MRSLIKAIVVSAALALAGCLVSETPVLDERTGKAKPMKPGAYVMCPVGDEASEDDCERFAISIDDTGLYRFVKDAGDEDDAEMRFRRIGRRAYAVQSKEGSDEYAYYFGRGDSKRFELTMMMCAALSEKTRSRLIESGDLSTDSEDFDTCKVNTLRGLTDAARDYLRGRTDDGEEKIFMTFTPAP